MQAHTSIQSKSDPKVSIWAMLSIEVKKSEKPWVIFTSDRRKLSDILGGYRILNHTHNLGQGRKMLLEATEINKFHPSSHRTRLGRNGYVSFANGKVRNYLPRLQPLQRHASKDTD